MRHGAGACVTAMALVLLVAPVDGDAQPAGRMYRVGLLSADNPTSASGSRVDDLQQGLRDLKYVEGQNLAIEYRHADGEVARLPELAAELVRLRVDVIVTAGESAASAAKRATGAVPIVATELGQDPVKAGLVASLGRPGGNVTGLATQSEELWQKRLALLKEVAPRVSRVALVLNPANPGNASCVEEIRSAAPGLGLELTRVEAKDAGALERGLRGVPNDAADAVAICWDSVTLTGARTIAEFALKRRIPTLAPLREYVQAGVLLSFGTSLPVQRRRAAYYVDRILKGTKPADLPVERPTLFELVVNLATAKTLGLTLPPALVVLADELIQ